MPCASAFAVGPTPLLSQSRLLRGGTRTGSGSHANVFPARATGGDVGELVLTANPVEDYQVRALIREEHVARDFGVQVYPGGCLGRKQHL